MHYEVLGERTYPFPNFNDTTVEVSEWISNLFHTYVNIYAR